MSVRKPGFTLVELLVVIAIIGILAGILLPVLANARNAAKKAKCVVNLDQIVLACQTYSNDSDGHFPYVAGDTPLQSLQRLYPVYQSEPSIFACPGTTDNLSGVALKTYTSAGPGSGVDLTGALTSYGFDQRHGAEHNGGLVGDYKGGSATSNSTNHGTVSGKGAGQNLSFCIRGTLFTTSNTRQVQGNTDNLFADDSATLGVSSDTYLQQ